MTKEQIEFLQSLQVELNTQNKVGQADPRFWVVAQYEWQNCWEENADKTVLYCPELENEYENLEKLTKAFIERGVIEPEDIEELIDYEIEEKLKEIYNFYEVPMKKVHVIKQDTMFLTIRECKEHIKRNDYHYNDTVHTYAMTAWRSPQVEKLIKLLQEADFNDLGELTNEGS